MANNSYYNAQRRDGGQKLITQALTAYEVRNVNQGYQFRVNGILDLYPTRQRFHNLRTNERGSYPNTDAGKLIAFVVQQISGAPKESLTARHSVSKRGECLFCGALAKLRMCNECKRKPIWKLNPRRPALNRNAQQSAESTAQDGSAKAGA